MPIRGYSVAVVVSDRKKSAAWYVNKLGFRRYDTDEEHWITVGDREGGFRLHLCELRKTGTRPKASEVGNTGILLTTNEPLPRAYARLKRKGVDFSEPPVERPWGWVSKFLDPDGNEFWLVPAW